MKSKLPKRPNSEYKTYPIDAADQQIGRLASRVASIVLGKSEPDYTPNNIARVNVVISNIRKVKISDKKLDENKYYRTSGYPGGLKEKTWREVYDKGPEYLFMKILRNMLPSNKLRVGMLKRVKFE